LTVPTDYADTPRRAENLLTSTLESWKSGVSTVTDQVRAFPTPNTFPQFDATEAVERQFAFIKRVVDLNHEYARSLAEIANTLTGVTRQQIDSVSSAVREQVQGVSDAARSGVDIIERTARDQAQQAERVEAEAREAAEEAQRQQAREAARVERQQRKEAHDQARERYESLTKNELSDEAGKRGLPKTGTVDELIERLVENDTTEDSK
jgi:F0F1-type ATP synthase membrane subunit b/b'